MNFDAVKDHFRPLSEAEFLALVRQHCPQPSGGAPVPLSPRLRSMHDTLDAADAAMNSKLEPRDEA